MNPHNPSSCTCGLGAGPCPDHSRKPAPMTTHDEAGRIAAEIGMELRKWWSFDDGQRHTHSWHEREDFISKELPKLIAAAMREARKAPAGCILDHSGTVRKVLGTLPITADGCLVGVDAEVWRAPHAAIDGKTRSEVLRFVWGWGTIHTLPSSWYSTREAAEAANGGKP